MQLLCRKIQISVTKLEIIKFISQRTSRCVVELQKMVRFPSNVTVFQYNETNVMNISLNLLRIKGLYMFRALLAHLQEALAQTAFGILREYNVSCSAVTRLQFHCNRDYMFGDSNHQTYNHLYKE
jgi:hypothetical protein